MRKVLISVIVFALAGQISVAKASSAPRMNIEVSTSTKVKVSKALRDLPPLQKITPQRKTKLIQSGIPVPGVDVIKEVPNYFRKKKQSLSEDYNDPVLQKTLDTKKRSGNAPTIGVNFEGMQNPQGYVPPDTNGSVGLNHYVQTVNVSIAIWDKAGNQLMQPVGINQLWAGFGGICENNNNGDPIVIYDKRADRWMISQFALADNDNHQCIAVSQTADPTGAYYLYDFPYGVLMNDYPHFGIFGDAYYMGVNQFGPGFSGGGVAAYERNKMLIGAEAQQVVISGEGMTPQVFTPMPLDVDGILPPPADMKELFLTSDSSGSSNLLHIWEMDVDWTNASAATFTHKTSLTVAQYTSPGNAIQPNGIELDGSDIRAMFRTSYRNFNGLGKILFTHNISGTNGQPVARWYQIDIDHNNGNALSVEQQGTFSPDTLLVPSSASRWMASGAMDASGNIAIGYSVADANIFPSIYAATRLANDPVNQLTDEFVLIAGSGSQGPVNRNRWGDYASMSIDPIDDCTFWYTNQYYKSANDSTLTWSTRIASFKIPTCSTGPTGEISGTVTGLESGEVIANATVSAANISTITDNEGKFKLLVPTGDYELSVSRYGWVTMQKPVITVAEDDTITSDFALTVAPKVDIKGVVSDGGGQGWPLYAKVSASVPNDTIVAYTNPETGEYTLSVFAGTSINITARALLSDYSATTQTILPTVANSATSLNISLATNDSCTTKGYQFIEPSFVQHFNGDTFPPADWTVIDDAGNGVIWSSALAGLGNITGTSGDAALANSDAAGPSISADTSLISPVIKVSDINSTTLDFVANYTTFTGQDSVDVDINVDGNGWVNITSLSTGTLNYSEDLSTQLSGATSFQLRWRYYNAVYEWFTSVDDVSIGNSLCEAVSGSWVSGYITDTNTGEPLNNVSITADGIELAKSTKTADDEVLGDGFVSFFMPVDSNLVVSASKYQNKQITATDLSLETPISLDAGKLSLDKQAISISITQTRTEEETVTVTNSGTAVANYKVRFFKPSASLPNGPFQQSTRHMGPKDLLNLDASKIRYFPKQTLGSTKLVDAIKTFPTNITYGWGLSRSSEDNQFYIGDIVENGAAEDKIWRYDTQGNKTEQGLVTHFGGTFLGDSTFNQRTGMLWQLNVGGDNCIYEIDTAIMAVTGNKICPAFGTSQRGLAYDPLSDTFYSGSWNDSVIHQFTTDGTIIRSINVSLAVAGLAFNASSGHLFVSVNQGLNDIVILDANTATLEALDAIDVQFDLDGDGVLSDKIIIEAGLDIDCDGNLWLLDQNRQVVVGFSSAETGVCDLTPAWLTSIDDTQTLAIDGTFEQNLSVDANLAVGDYRANMIFVDDTPYVSKSVPVSLTVAEPQNGQLGFAISSIEVNENDTTTITVDRTDGADFAISVDYATIDGSAIAGQDYVAANGTLTWDDLDTESKTITIQTNKLSVHNNLSFSLELINPQGGASLGEQKAVNVSIVDLPNGVINFAVSNVTVNENDTTTITVDRTDGDNFAISVDYATIDDSAIVGQDYVAANGTLTWGDLDTESKTITIQTNKLSVHNNLSFSLELVNPQGGASLGVQKAIEVFIMDLPNGLLHFAATNATVEEENTITLTVERTDGANFSVSVNYATSNGSANAGTEYTANSGTLVWEDQDTASKNITIATNKVKKDSNFSVTLSHPQGGAELGSAITTIVNIKKKPSSGSFGFLLIFNMVLIAFYRRKKSIITR